LNLQRSPADTTVVSDIHAMDATRGVIGVLGGMGPLATVDFLQKLIAATPSTCDQDHVPVVVSSIAQIPDRVAAFRSEGASPLAAMVSSGQRLIRAGAGLIVVPCNTAHLWFSELQAALQLPMLHMVDVALEDAANGMQANASVGLLCTDATLASGLYLRRAAQSKRHSRLRWTLPTAAEMLNLVMPGIQAVKLGQMASANDLLSAAAQALIQRGASSLVLGCTEIPLVLNGTSSQIKVPVTDATTSLARRAVAWSLAQRELALR
jgi:aspartate racemase